MNENDTKLLSKNGIVVYEDTFGKLRLHHEHNESVAMLARDGDSILLIKQFRKAVESSVIQLPGGGVKPGEDRESAVRREFAEETGYQCGAIIHLGTIHASSWRSNEISHIFYTEELLDCTNQQLEQHEKIEVVRVSTQDCAQQFQNGTITDPELAYALLQAHVRGLLQVPANGGTRNAAHIHNQAL